MPENLIPRNFYDVRFLEIPNNTEQNSLDSFVASQIHSIYPGNNGAYEYVYRIYNEQTAIIVFITKEVLSRYSKTPPVVPVFLLTSVNLKQKNVEAVFLYKTDVIEKIIFQDNKPVRSQLIDIEAFFPADTQTARWMFIDKPDSGFTMPNSDMILKVPRFSEQHRYKSLRLSKSFSFKGFYTMLLILLVLISGITFRYSQVVKQEIADYKKQQNQVMIFSSQKAEAEKEIASINDLITELGSRQIGNPYRLLSALYNSLGTTIHIQRVTIQNESFSIECLSRDPIKVSDILSKDPAFSDVSIQRIQETEEGNKLSLSGKYND